jgi:protein JSN1
MPSKLQEVAPRFSLPDDDEPTPTSITTPFSAAVRTSALAPAYPQTSPARPTLRHTASSAAELETPNRHRSGSLTLPQNGLGAAFGSSPFSNTWLANPGLTMGPSKSPLGKRLSTPDDDPMSFTSPSESAASLATDDLQFSTLDYLGLAEGGDGPLPPASMSELRNQAQRAIIANSGSASRTSRDRASTVSNFARPQYRPSITNSTGSYARDHNPYDTAQEDEALQRAIEQLGMYDAPSFGGLYGHFKDINRPRATTIGALDQPIRRSGLSGGLLSSIPQSPVQGQLVNPINFGAAYGYPPRSHSDRDLARSRDSSASRGPRMSISSHTSRTGTPDQDRGSSTPQMPSRSLWIGNLDVNATSDALLHVFAPYGAIESVRMLPEKVCHSICKVFSC